MFGTDMAGHTRIVGRISEQGGSVAALSLSLAASLGAKPDLPRECLRGVGWMDQLRPEKLHNTQPWIEALTHMEPSRIKKKTKSFSVFCSCFIGHVLYY